MIHYRDKTFCSFHENCKQGWNCDRKLTQAVRDGAAKANLPISQFADPPMSCFQPIRFFSSSSRFVRGDDADN